VAGDSRSSALDVDAGGLLSVESRHVVVVAAETPRRARVGALRSRLTVAYIHYTTSYKTWKMWQISITIIQSSTALILISKSSNKIDTL